MSGPHGVLVVDKPAGPTSHDVVARVRRLLGTRRVGHAGTLDPMATGVLVILVGEATKLSTWLTLDDKRYLARVVFGRSTDSLDATGTTEIDAPPPRWLEEEVEALTARRPDGAPRLAAALDAERAREAQIPPAFSAIQRDGVRSHALARRGQAVELAARAISVRALTVASAGRHDGDPDAGRPFVDLEVDVGKGYYVRSLARDLGEALAVPACLARLRRIASGPFTVATATSLDALAADDPAARAARLIAPGDAARAALATATLDAEGARRARLGQRLAREHFTTDLPELAGRPFAWLEPDGSLLAIGEAREGSFVVLRNLFGG